MKYTKQVIIEAIQWDGNKETSNKLRVLCGYWLSSPRWFEVEGAGYISTLDGLVLVHPGDWVIRDDDGCYTCKSDEFEKVYTKYEEE